MNIIKLGSFNSFRCFSSFIILALYVKNIKIINLKKCNYRSHIWSQGAFLSFLNTFISFPNKVLLFELAVMILASSKMLVIVFSITDYRATIASYVNLGVSNLFSSHIILAVLLTNLINGTFLMSILVVF